MAGRGPQPKAVEKRARTNKDPLEMRILPAILAHQPQLPDFDVQVDYEGELVSQQFVWPQITRDWWQMWAESPLSVDFTSTDWSELLDTALLHAQYWSGKYSLAGEIRLRTAKFGATPEDRARLRIQFAQADQAEVSAVRAVSSRDRFRGMSVPVDGGLG